MNLINKIFNKQNIMNDLPAIAEKLYPDEIQQIHNEFECASDKLLKEANEIIAESSKADVSKLNRLEALGFKQANNVKEIKQLVEKVKLSEEQVKTIQYYKEQYPFNKFITEEQVEIICKKYNLVCGGVDRYKGFVPEKNLKEIEGFKLKDPEKGLYADNGMFFHNAEVFTEDGFYFHIRKIREKNKYNYSFQKSPNNGDRFYASDKLNIFGYANKGDIRFTLVNPLHICAPIKDMDISGMDLNNGYKLAEHIPDPVVLHKVKFGYLVLSKWGAEASDPILLNEIDN